MQRQTMIVTLAIVAIIGPAAGVILSQCQLATILLNQGISNNLIPDWVCLIIAESSGNSTIIDGPNSNGDTFYGLFQVNSKYWCGASGPGGDCNVACKSLADDCLTDDIACAKLIYAGQGFSAWWGWQDNCEGKSLPEITPC